VAALAGIAARTRRGESVPVDEIVICLRNLVDFYSELIWKENYQLFPLAQEVLSTHDEAEVLRMFGQSDWLIGTEQHAKYERFADELSARVG
jgi:hemerythrin-like domain-containing protein